MDEDFWARNRAIADEIESHLRETWAGVSVAAELGGIGVLYARDIDHLYVTIGTPKEAIGFTADDEMESILLYDPDSYDIRAIEVDMFFEKLQRAESCEPFWTLIKEMINLHGDTFFIPGKAEAKKVTSAFKKLAVV